MRFMQFRAHDKYALHLSKMEKVGSALAPRPLSVDIWLICRSLNCSARRSAGRISPICSVYPLPQEPCSVPPCWTPCCTRPSWRTMWLPLCGCCLALTKRRAVGSWPRFVPIWWWKAICPNFIIRRCASPRTTCGYAPMVGCIRSCAPPPAKYPLGFTARRTPRMRTRLMWVTRRSRDGDLSRPSAGIVCACVHRWVQGKTNNSKSQDQIPRSNF